MNVENTVSDLRETNITLARWISFFVVLLQFALIVLLIQQWDIKGRSVTQVMQLAFAGFIIHHLLPLRLRLPFFAALSMGATILILGDIGPQKIIGVLTGKTPLVDLFYRLIPGGTLIGIGLLVIGVCHLPIRLAFRIALLVLVGGGLSLARAHSDWFPDIPVAVWVILGSMFVFRVMVYIYDLKHRAAPFSPARAFSYFFMLPNVCFPLFPLVDYKTFCATYYNEDWPRIYQTGLLWMLRGLFQLLLYQAVYQFAPLDVAKLSSTLDVAGFVLATYLLYLHVSGQFHLIVGLLHMFGFNLPETHHLFLLASSFTDFWRRINIYWKDFVMKLFFYPSFFALRKRGTLLAMTLATLATFFLTWLLHSWQWFWIRGSFLFTWQDISFWAILAVLVLVNALFEATSTRQRKLTASRVTLRDRLWLGLKTTGTFATICLLWTLWSSQSGDELRTLADAALQPKLYEVLIILLVLAAIGVAGAVWGRSARDTSEGRPAPAVRGPFSFWRSAAGVSAVSVCLLVTPFLASRMFPRAEMAVARLRHDALNPRDLDQQRRGYYEELDAGRADNRHQLAVQEPEGWNKGTKVMYRDRPDFLRGEIVPSVSGILSGALATSNRLGMRDREYEKDKPANTQRIVLMGSSHELGVGVKNEETFENLVEDRLNALPDGTSRWEILNMSVAGNSVLQKLLRLEQVGFGYQPDTVMFCVNPFEWHFVIESVKGSLIQGIAPPPAYREIVDQVSRKAGVNGNMPALMIERRLRPCVSDVYAWVFNRFSQECAQRGIRPLVIYRPATLDLDGSEPASRAELIRLALAEGLEVIDLSSAFESVEDRNSLVLARWDDHATALGHRLLADKLYEGLVSRMVTSPEKEFSGQ